VKPLCVIGRQTAGREDAVNVRMEPSSGTIP
jgi:hypothetical protein